MHGVRAKLLVVFDSTLRVHNYSDFLDVFNLIQGDLLGVGVLAMPHTAIGKVLPIDFELAESLFNLL